MKLYFAPGACSLAVHVTLSEGQFSYTIERMDFGTRKTASGEDFLKINPKGYVPALALNDGEILTEVAVILQYLGLQKPELSLMPAAGSMPFFRCLEWLNFIATEIHKTFAPLFSPRASETTKAHQVETLARRFDYIVNRLGKHPYLMGDHFTVADAYLFTVLNWASFVKLDLDKWPALKDYIARVGARPAVRRALEEEGLVK